MNVCKWEFSFVLSSWWTENQYISCLFPPVFPFSTPFLQFASIFTSLVFWVLGVRSTMAKPVKTKLLCDFTLTCFRHLSQHWETAAAQQTAAQCFVNASITTRGRATLWMEVDWTSPHNQLKNLFIFYQIEFSTISCF